MADETIPRETIPRRQFLVGAGLAGAVATGLTQPAQAQDQPQRPSPNVVTPQAGSSVGTAPAPVGEPLLLLNETEHAFVVAAVDTLIPADELSPSGSDCGCAAYIDRQLASAWGGGAKMYRAGPYFKGKPEQGYQLPLRRRNSSRPALPPPTPGRERPTGTTSTASRRPSGSRR